MIKSDYSAIEVGQKSLVKAALARQKFEAEILDTGKEQEIFFNPAMLKKRENFAKNIERSNLILQTSQKEVVTKIVSKTERNTTAHVMHLNGC